MAYPPEPPSPWKPPVGPIPPTRNSTPRRCSTVRLRDFDPLEHQRLVVNPFLAVFGLVGLW